jgi:hypothetical protein
MWSSGASRQLFSGTIVAPYRLKFAIIEDALWTALNANRVTRIKKSLGRCWSKGGPVLKKLACWN